jgi:hypothetical protein
MLQAIALLASLAATQARAADEKLVGRWNAAGGGLHFDNRKR